MRIALRRRDLLLLFLLLTLVALFVLSSLLLNALAQVHGWQIMSPLKAAVPNMMYGGSLMFGG